MPCAGGQPGSPSHPLIGQVSRACPSVAGRLFSNWSLPGACSERPVERPGSSSRGRPPCSPVPPAPAPPPPPVPPAQAPRQPSPARRVLFFPGGGGFRVRKALGDPPVVSCPHRAVRFLRLENPQDRLAAKALLSLTSGKPALVVITQKDSRLSGAGVALCLLWLANFLENYMQCCVVVSNFRGS